MLILFQHALGRSFERGYSFYPGRDAMYGQPSPPSDGGAGEALRGWPKKVQEQRAKANIQQYYGRDFVKLNRYGFFKHFLGELCKIYLLMY